MPAAGALSESGDPLIGAVLLDRVRIVRAIARGGMGKVYFGEQTHMKRPCAIKVLDPRLAASGADAADFARRFVLEASVAAKLTHPNVVTIFDYGETEDGRCFIAMEYLEGRSLSDELKRNGRVAPERAIHIARQVCRALREAHGLGVVHRDIKPGNVLLMSRDDDEDFVKVLDFGLVKETKSGVEAADQHTQIGRIMGSPRYMAPEQIQGKPVDARTDVYSVGATLYAMLTGKPPFERATELATMMAHVSDAVPSIASVAPDVVLPQGLEAIVTKCLAKKPDDRFASMEEVIAALKLRPGGVLTASDSGSHPSPLLAPPVLETLAAAEPPRRARPTAAMIVVAMTVGAAALLMVTRRAGDTRATGVEAPASAPAVSSAAPVPPPPSAPMASATLHVDTDPPGAKVKEDGATLCAATPCDIVYTGASADAGVEHLLEIMRADYKIERKIVTVGASPLVVKLTKSR